MLVCQENLTVRDKEREKGDEKWWEGAGRYGVRRGGVEGGMG